MDEPLPLNEVGLAGDSAVQTEALEELSGLPHYQDWLVSLAEPWLGDNPVELGSGNGDYAAQWLERGLDRITLTEADPHRHKLLVDRFAGDCRVKFAAVDLDAPAHADHSAIVSFNVLEHILDDTAALRASHHLVRPGGHVFHLVPAFPFAMSRFDREIGHHRRYHKDSLVQKARDAGLDVEDVRYLNAPGLPAWFVMMRLLRGRPTVGPALKVWDNLVIPVARRIESHVRMPFGQSVVLVARTPAK